MTSATYTEDLFVPVGVMVRGKHVVTGTAGALTWTRATSPADRTPIQSTTASGLRFALGATRATGLDGVVVRGAVFSSPPAQATVISINRASPTLRDFQVFGWTAPSIPVIGIGVSISGNGLTFPTPLLEGAATGTASFVGSIRGSMSATGLEILDASPELTNVNISDVSAPRAYGTRIVNGPNMRFTQGSSFAASGGTACYGVYATSNVGGLVFDRVSAGGCSGLGGGLVPLENYGVVFDQCSPLAMAAPPVYRNAPSIVGGPANATSPSLPGIAVGVRASAGCGLELLANSFVTGANGPSVTQPLTAIGVWCTREGFTFANGPDAPCRVIGNGTIVGSTNSSATNAYGIRCQGSCATGSLSCPGSCAEISDNKGSGNGTGGVYAGFGQFQTHLAIEQSDPLVVRNTFAPPIATSTGSCSVSRGGQLVGSGAFVANNLFMGGSCQTGVSIGLSLQSATRASAQVPSPLVHSNTILSHFPGSTPANIQAGLSLAPLQGSVTASRQGTIVNNIIQAGPGGSASFYAVEEVATNVDPVAFLHNDLVIYGGLPPFPLYRDEGSTTLTTPAQVNGMTGTTASANVSIVPDLVWDQLPHLDGGSAVRGLGATDAGTPFDDWDGEPRPTPDGGAPDLGADELP